MNQPWNVHPLPEAKNSGGVELEDQWFEVYRISVWSVRIEVAGSDLRCPVLSPPFVCELPGPRTDTRHLNPQTGTPAPRASGFILSDSPPPPGPAKKPNFRAECEETCQLGYSS